MSDPKYDIDKAMASDAARDIINRVLSGSCIKSEGNLCQELRQAARVLTVAEADREYVDWLLSGDKTGHGDGGLEQACRDARKREKEESE